MRIFHYLLHQEQTKTSASLARQGRGPSAAPARPPSMGGRGQGIRQP